MGRWQQLTDRVMRACRDTFTTEFSYLPKVGGTHALKGVFDEAFVSVQMIDGAPVQSVSPAMGVRVADLVAASITPGPGDRITIGSKNYDVDEYQPDGQAGGVLILSARSGS